jgi:tRNA dimethylallyltransferase
VKNVFYIVGPTAAGKSELAAEVAARLDAEIVSADAFQIYRGLDLLTAKPDATTLRRVPHHLIGTINPDEEMNAEIFRGLALAVIHAIHQRGRPALVVGGSGLYVKALTHGLSSLPEADPELRRRLDQLSVYELGIRLSQLDASTAARIDLKNRRRLTRAVEICLLTGRPAAAQRNTWQSQAPGQEPCPVRGVFVFRDRDDLYARINHRVERMFELGVVEETRAISKMSATAGKMLGLNELRELVDGRMTRAECVASIQRSTRRYAKRQLTWFRRQTNFESQNLSLLSHVEAVEWTTQRALSLSR